MTQLARLDDTDDDAQELIAALIRQLGLFARRLQVQDRLTTQIAEALDRVLEPLGVGVVVEASHLCMMMRGVQMQNSRTVTSSMCGAFLTDARTRMEFMNLIHAQNAASVSA